MNLSRDEIITSLSSTVDEYERIDLLNRLSYVNSRSDHKRARECYEEALASALALRYDKGIALALANRAIDFTRSCSFEQALSDLEEAQAILNTLPLEDRGELKLVVNCIGTVYLDLGDYSKASLYFRETLNLTEDSDDVEFLGKIYINLSTIHSRIKQWDKALEYGNRAYEILKDSDYHNSLVVILNNMSDIYNAIGSYKEAISFIERALTIADRYDLKSLRPLLLHSHGEVYINLEDYEKALTFFLLSLDEAEESGLLFDEIASLERLGIISERMDNSEMALFYLEEGLRKAAENSLPAFIMSFNGALYRLYKRLGDYERALTHHEVYHEMEKESRSLEMESNIRNIESDSLKKVNRRIKVISSIGREITSSLDMKSVLNSIYQSVSSLMPTSFFGIADYESDKGRITYKMFLEEGIEVPTRYSSIDNRNSLAAFAIRENRDIIINDFFREYHRYMDNYESSPIGVNENEYAQSLIITPLYINNEITGIITVQSYQKRAYNLSDLDTLKALASYMAIALRNAEQAELIKRKNERLKQLAITDALTGLYNRREFEKRFLRLWSRRDGQNNHFSILIIDADNFKRLNDTYGHLAGDECLKSLAATLQNSINNTMGCLARYGGEEFIILLNIPAEEAVDLADKLCQSVRENEIRYNDINIPLTISIGVSSIKTSNQHKVRTPEQLINMADEALYRSKRAGRDRTTFLPLSSD